MYGERLEGEMSSRDQLEESQIDHELNGDSEIFDESERSETTEQQFPFERKPLGKQTVVFPAGEKASIFSFGKCKVCKDKATGMHYGVNTCEGCKVYTLLCFCFFFNNQFLALSIKFVFVFSKGFFKRGLTKNHTYVCYYGNKCQMTPKERKRCKLCRWKSCVASGMAFEGNKHNICSFFFSKTCH
jgi:hypothetical protein